MPNFNWKEKTGISETQWVQMFIAVLSSIAMYFNLHELSVQIGLAAQFIVGGIGVYLRRKDKKDV